jgi:exodeoxyribonuclease VIII
MQVTRELLDHRPLSFSSLKEFMRSPQHYVKYLASDRKQTEAMLFGAICHKLILEPQLFDKEYIIEPEFNKRTNQGKEDYAAFIAKITEQNLTAVPPATYEKAVSLVESVMKSNAAKYIYDATIKEGRFDMTHDIGLPVCGYIDGVGKDYNLEIKIVSSADTDDIMRDFYKMKYHIQAGIYNWVNGKPIYYLVVENSYPYLSKVFKASDEYIAEGKRLFNKAMSDFKFCLDMNNFSAGYDFYEGKQPLTLTLPGWVKVGGADD